MSEPVLYNGPRTEYFDDVGEFEGPAQSTTARSYMQMSRWNTTHSRPKLRHETTPRTLITADQASSRHSRFQALFSTAMSPRISPRESTRFIDRFRYVICTSQLLSESVLASNYQEMPSGVQTTKNIQFDDGEQAEWDERKAAKYWMGSGGCVILVSLLITWALRTPDRGLSGKSRTSAAMVMSMCIALFLYAQSRRAYTRHLHIRAVSLIQQLALHCQTFDSMTCRTINLVQEVELVSRGFQIGTGQCPISRIEAHSSSRRCIRLRSALSSALKLIFAANGRACTRLESVTNTRDYNKLSDVYNIVVNGDDDLADLYDDGDSIAHLKALFHQMHNKRRQLFCCLLAVQADGRPGNSKTWRVVTTDLALLSNLTAGLANQLQETLDDDALVLDPNQLTAANPTTDVEALQRQRAHARGLNTLSQTLRRTQAKMYILREESSRILQQSDTADRAKDELLLQYDSLGGDLQALLADWQDGRQVFEKDHQNRPSKSNLEAASFQEQLYEGGDLETTSLLIRPNSLGYWGPRMSMHNISGVDGSLYTPLEEALQEELYEGETSNDPEPPSRKLGMSRAERIAIMRLEREEKQARSEERRLQMESKRNLQGELKDVLGNRNRRPGLRLSVHNTRYIPPVTESSAAETMLSPPLENGDRKVSTSSQQSTGTMNSGLGSSISSHHNYGP